MYHDNCLRVLAGSLGLALVAACGSVQAADPRNEDGGGAVLEIPGWSLREQARAGGAAADESAQLYTVTSVAEDTEGQFYVSSFGEKRVLVFDSTGRYVRTMGRAGHGPGEFTAPRSISVAADELLVLDMGAARISRFRRADGAHLGDAGLSRDVGMPVDMRATPDGRVAIEFRARTADRLQAPALVVPVDPATGRLDVAMAVRMDTVARVQVRTQLNGQRAQRTFDVPFAPKPVWDLEPSGAVTYGTGAEFVVSRASGGTVTERFRSGAAAKPVTRSDQERFFEEPARQNLRGMIEFPETKPFFTGLRIDPGGNVWLNVPDREEGERWEVRDSSSQKLGELRLSGRDRLMHVGPRSIYVLTRDGLDVETLIRYTLVR